MKNRRERREERNNRWNGIQLHLKYTRLSPKGIWNEKQSFRSYYLDEKFPINSWSGSLFTASSQTPKHDAIWCWAKKLLLCVKWNCYWKQNGNRKGDEKNNFVGTVEDSSRTVVVCTRGVKSEKFSCHPEGNQGVKRERSREETFSLIEFDWRGWRTNK